MWVHEDKYQIPTVKETKEEVQGTATDVFKACPGTFSVVKNHFVLFAILKMSSKKWDTLPLY